jgi:hypothetical protein
MLVDAGGERMAPGANLPSLQIWRSTSPGSLLVALRLVGARAHALKTQSVRGYFRASPREARASTTILDELELPASGETRNRTGPFAIGRTAPEVMLSHQLRRRVMRLGIAAERRPGAAPPRNRPGGPISRLVGSGGERVRDLDVLGVSVGMVKRA